MPEEKTGLGVAHRGWVDAPIAGHRFDEQAVDAIDLGLEEGVGFAGNRLVRVEIVLAITSKHGGVANAVLHILLGLVDVHGNDANRANTASARDEDLAGSRCQCVGRREGHVVGHGPDGLDLACCTNAVGQIEHATGLATRRIDVEQDGRNLWTGQCRIQLSGKAGIAGQAGLGFQSYGTAHQGAVNRNDCDLGCLSRRITGWRRESCGCSEIG